MCERRTVAVGGAEEAECCTLESKMRGQATLTKRPVSLKENSKTGAIVFDLTAKTASASDVHSEMEIKAELKLDNTIPVISDDDADDGGTRTPPDLVLDPNRGYSTMDYRRGRPFFHESPMSSPKTFGSPRESAPSRRRIDVSRLADATYDYESPGSTMDELTLTSTCTDLYLDDCDLETKQDTPNSKKSVGWTDQPKQN